MQEFADASMSRDAKVDKEFWGDILCSLSSAISQNLSVKSLFFFQNEISLFHKQDEKRERIISVGQRSSPSPTSDGACELDYFRE